MAAKSRTAKFYAANPAARKRNLLMIKNGTAGLHQKNIGRNYLGKDVLAESWAKGAKM